MFATKVRRQEISASDLLLLRRRFLAEARQGLFQVVSLRKSTYLAAMRLLAEYATRDSLKTLDALQLAVAIELQSDGQLDHLVTADKRLAIVAARAGLAVLNPEDESP